MTQQLDIDFVWHKCPHGYKLITEEEWLDLILENFPPAPNDFQAGPNTIKVSLNGPVAGPKDPRQIELVRQIRQNVIRNHEVDVANRQPFAIVPKSKTLIPCRPLDGHESIFKIFAQVKTPQDLLKFNTRYGMLKDKRLPNESIKDGLNAARRFRYLLSCKSKGPKKLAAVFSAQLQENVQPRSTPNSLIVGEIRIVPDPARGVRLRLITHSLINAMWWQLNQRVAGETIFRVCRQCGNPFEAGPGGDARLDATFCCHECSVLFHSLKRSKGA
jgi:hypothetical protein